MKLAHLARNVLLVTLLTASALYAKPSVASAKPNPSVALSNWKDAVESRKLSAVMKLYDNDAVMIPTFAQSPLLKRSQIEEYFKVVLANDGVHVDILESHPRILGDIAIDDGRYELSYTQEGEQVSIPARFTFVYQLDGDKWMIIDHHASQMPDKREKK